MNRIVITYEIIEHPYSDETNRTVYGKLNACLENEFGLKIMTLTDNVIDLISYFGWFSKNMDQLVNQNVLSFFPAGDSISERVHKFINQVEYEDIWQEIEEKGLYDIYYNYSQSHAYHNSQIGSGETKVNFSRPLYMGLNCGEYEISMYSEEDEKRNIQFEHWKYSFDLKGLVNYANNELNKILKDPFGHNESNKRKYFQKENN